MKKIVFAFIAMFLLINVFETQEASAQQRLKEINIYLQLWAKGARDEGSSVYANNQRHYFNRQSYLSVMVPNNSSISIEILASGGGWLHSTNHSPQFIPGGVCADRYYYINDNYNSSTPIYIKLLD